MFTGLEPLCREDRLTELQLFSLEKRRLWEHLLAAFQHMKRAYKRAREFSQRHVGIGQRRMSLS